MNHSVITVCPKCKKEVSEFALLCSNCGCSLDKQPPIKTDAASLRKKPKLHTSRAMIICMILSVITGALSFFVLSQTVLAYKVFIGTLSIDRIILFRNTIAQSLSGIGIAFLSSISFFVISLAIIIVLIIKAFARKIETWRIEYETIPSFSLVPCLYILE